MRMTTEQHLQKGQELARALAEVDDNEVKKVWSFLCRQRHLPALHQLVKELPASPFKNRSRRTQGYYDKMKEVIPRHLPQMMEIDDAVQIFGWACRLLKYEALRREHQRSEGTGQHAGSSKGKGPQGKKRR